MTTPATDPVLRRIDAGLAALASLGGDLVGQARSLAATLWSPPRVVVVGRLKAGKSTLVNALIGAPVAETAALEATNVVTVYDDGAPSRADIHLLDGRHRTVALVPGATVDLGCSPTEVAYVHRHLPSQALRRLALVDTPGLATLTVDNAAATRRALIDGFEQTRSASVDADAAVFLFDSAPRADEIDFLHRLGFTPMNTLGVLSRADGFGRGALGRVDPIEHAGAHARRMAARLTEVVGGVVPVAGLLAETSHTGALTEQDARALATLAPYEPLELFDLVDSGVGLPVTGAEVDRLLDLLGEYGLLHGRSHARGAHALARWLTERSGIATVREVLESSLRSYAVLQRAGRILSAIDVLADSHPARHHIRDIGRGLAMDPVLIPVLLLRALRGLLATDPTSPAVGELTRILRGGSFAQSLGLDPAAPADLVRTTAEASLAEAQRRSLSSATQAEHAAAATLIHTYMTMCRQLGTR